MHIQAIHLTSYIFIQTLEETESDNKYSTWYIVDTLNFQSSELHDKISWSDWDNNSKGPHLTHYSRTAAEAAVIL